MGPPRAITPPGVPPARPPRRLNAAALGGLARRGRNAMKLRAVVAVAAGLLLGADAPRSPEAAGDLARLRGEWRLASTADARRTDLGNDLIRMTITGDGRVIFKFGE